MGAYELEEGGVLEVRVGVQRSLQQQPPWARERRRGGHLCLSPPPAVSRQSHWNVRLTLVFFKTLVSLLDQRTVTSSTNHFTIDAGGSSNHDDGGVETASLANS